MRLPWRRTIHPVPAKGPEPRTWPVDHRAARSWPPVEGREARPDQYESGPVQQAEPPQAQADVAPDQGAASAPAQSAPDQGGGGQASEGIA